jgi:hypothetical protein
MTLAELKESVDKACEYAPEATVEIWYKQKMYRVGRTSQSQLLGSLFIEVGELAYNGGMGRREKAENDADSL